MRLLPALALLVTLAAAEGDRPCGFRIAPCPDSQTCSNIDPSCLGENCQGRCVPGPTADGTISLTDPVPTDDGGEDEGDDGEEEGGEEEDDEEEEEGSVPEYAPCGGDRREGPLDCEEGFACVDNPRADDGCGLDCDAAGICVPKGLVMCGGFAGFPCDEEGRICIDDPFDDCDPLGFDADCAGICV